MFLRLGHKRSCWGGLRAVGGVEVMRYFGFMVVEKRTGKFVINSLLCKDDEWMFL